MGQDLMCTWRPLPAGTSVLLWRSVRPLHGGQVQVQCRHVDCQQLGSRDHHEGRHLLDVTPAALASYRALFGLLTFHDEIDQVLMDAVGAP